MPVAWLIVDEPSDTVAVAFIVVDVVSADRSTRNGGPKIIEGEECVAVVETTGGVGEIIVGIVSEETVVLAGARVAVAISKLDVVDVAFFDTDTREDAVDALLVVVAFPDEDACAIGAGETSVVIVVVSAETTLDVVSAKATEIGHHKYDAVVDAEMVEFPLEVDRLVLETVCTIFGADGNVPEASFVETEDVVVSLPPTTFQIKVMPTRSITPVVLKLDGRKPPQKICVEGTLKIAEFEALNVELANPIDRFSGVPWAF